MFPSATTTGMGNTGCSGSYCYSWIPHSYADKVQDYLHEIGHNLNLAHAGDLTQSGSGAEYGDMSCAMGFCCSIRCYNAPHAWELGWLEGTVLGSTLTEGLMLGATLVVGAWLSDGIILGEVLGNELGCRLTDGIALGGALGQREGASVGSKVGTGLAEGRSLGNGLGAMEGRSDGVLLGIELSDGATELSLGATDGAKLLRHIDQPSPLPSGRFGEAGPVLKIS